MIKYFTIEDLLKHYLQKKFHILLFCIALRDVRYLLTWHTFFMKHKNMDCQKKYQHNRNPPVDLKYDRTTIQNHTAHSAPERNQNHNKQQPPFSAHLFPTGHHVKTTQ